jgi:hypothetical protein
MDPFSEDLRDDVAQPCRTSLLPGDLAGNRL